MFEAFNFEMVAHTTHTCTRWVFRQIYDKGLVYRGWKVMPFSTQCHTPLSNFEAGQNYKEVQDPAGESSVSLVSLSCP